MGYVAAADALARPRLYPIPDEIIGPFSDGSHLYWRDAHGLHVVRDGERWSAVKTFPPPAGCGTFVAVAGGYALFSCRDAEARLELRLVDLDDGATVVPPAEELLRVQDASPDSTYSAEGLGVRLVDIVAAESHGSEHRYFDWRRGQFIKDPVVSARAPLSLDTRGGTRRLCRPLQVTTHYGRDHSGARVDQFDTYVYRVPYLVTVHRGQLVLRRCGSHKKQVLARPIDVNFTRDYVAWTTRRNLYVRLFRGGRTLKYGLPIRGRGTVGGSRGSVVLFIHGRRWAVDLHARRLASM